MVDTEWPAYWHDAFRIELRAAAIGLAWRGWPVFPGTYPDSNRSMDHDSPEAGSAWTRPVPAHSDWRQRIGAHPQQVASWWADRPYSVLVATGTMLDAIEVDDQLGRRAATLLRATGRPAPIVAMPNRRWLFLTATASGIPAALAKGTNIQWHNEGSWVPLPPTPFEQGVIHWRVKPEIWDWRLPCAIVVHDVLVRALPSQSHMETVQSVAAVNSSAA